MFWMIIYNGNFVAVCVTITHPHYLIPLSTVKLDKTKNIEEIEEISLSLPFLLLNLLSFFKSSKLIQNLDLSAEIESDCGTDKQTRFYLPKTKTGRQNDDSKQFGAIRLTQSINKQL